MARIASWENCVRVLAVVALTAGPGLADDDAGPPAATRRVVILHTNDLHSHLMGFAPEADYTPASRKDDDTSGGVARLAATIARARRQAGETPTILLDAGDFTMGTPFHLLGPAMAPELMLMQRMGYDAITLGNHEFDWTPLGLAATLAAATRQGFDVPLLATNLQFDAAAPEDDALETFAPSLIRRQVVKVLPNGLKVGLFGLLLPIDDRRRGDASVQAQVDAYVAVLDQVLAPAGLAYRQTLVETAFDVPDAPFVETSVGDLVTDAYRGVVAGLQPAGRAPIALEFNGLIRAGLRAGTAGRQWFADLFRVLPLGIGPDGQPGYPLVTFYLSGRGLESVFEVSAAASDVFGSNDFFSQVSGLHVEYDPGRPPFDRVTRLASEPGAAPIDLGDPAVCHRVTANLYVASLLGQVEAATGGALSLTPTEADCRTPVGDWSSMIVDRDPATDGIQELKAWQALVGYVAALPDASGNGIPDLPVSYAESAHRVTRRE